MCVSPKVPFPRIIQVGWDILLNTPSNDCMFSLLFSSYHNNNQHTSKPHSTKKRRQQISTNPMSVSSDYMGEKRKKRWEGKRARGQERTSELIECT
jgi:hypothetical protein